MLDVGFGFVQLSLEYCRLDGEQRVTLLHLLSFYEVAFDDLSGNLGSQYGRRIRKDGADRVDGGFEATGRRNHRLDGYLHATGWATLCHCQHRQDEENCEGSQEFHLFSGRDT